MKPLDNNLKTNDEINNANQNYNKRNKAESMEHHEELKLYE